MSKSLRNYTLWADKQISITYQKQLLKALTHDIGGIKAALLYSKNWNSQQHITKKKHW